MTYRNITEIKKANKAAGKYWFSPATIKAFASRVETPIMEGRYWVESTRNYDDTARDYKLVVADDSGNVEYVRDPAGYDILCFSTRVAAIDALTEHIAAQHAVSQ
jgi:hypothetical protein